MRDQVLLRRYRARQRSFREARIRGWLGLKPAALAGVNLRGVDLRGADLHRAMGEVMTVAIPGAGQVTFAYVTDPEGNVVELQRWSGG